MKTIKFIAGVVLFAFGGIGLLTTFSQPFDLFSLVFALLFMGGGFSLVKKNRMAKTSHTVIKAKTEKPSQSPAVGIKTLQRMSDVAEIPISFVMIDLETTGLNSYNAEIIEFAAIKYINGQPVDRLHALINPGVKIPKDATRVNHITDKMVENQPRIDEVIDKIYDFINHEVLAGYNVEFDIQFLNQAFKKHGKYIENIIVIDVLTLARKVLRKSEVENYKLDTVKQYLQIDTPSHRALDDCDAAFQVMVRCVELNSLQPARSSKVDDQNVKMNNKNFRSDSKKISTLVCENDDLDPSHPLFGKVCVLTGELTAMSRSNAMQAIVNAGGVLKTSVSAKTDYLIVGQQDHGVVGEDGLSGKQEKAYDLISKGVNIKILNESDFLETLNGAASN